MEGVASGGISEIILFIGAIVVAASVSVTLIGVSDEAAQSVETAGDRFASEMESDLLIVSDPGSSAVYDASNETVILLAKNTGDNRLYKDETFVLINGKHYKPTSVEVVSSSENKWREGEVVRIKANATLDSNTEYRLGVRSGTAGDVIEYYTG